MAFSKADVLAHAKEHQVKFVNLQFVDIHGVPKGVGIPIKQLEDAIDNNAWFDGSSIEGFARISESDMYLKPDLDTWAIIPWSRQTPSVTARLICDVYLPDGEPFPGDPRYILKQQLARARRMGYIFNTGPELEFFLFRKENHKLSPLPHDTAGYFDQTTDLAHEIRKEMTFALEEFGIEVEALHHEVAAGQHEIDFRYGDALRCADHAMTLKMVLKTVAARHELHATFMPKPIAGINGSGMHVHQSLFSVDGRKNLFYDPSDEYHLSTVARQFIAGQLAHIHALNAVLNPLVNSYKRLVVGYEAPVYVAWGQRNRSALVRIPRYTPGREKAVRAELRCPDPAANPYLAFACMLAAGLDGIEKKMQPPPPVEENIYEFTAAHAAERRISTVARNLYDALEALKQNKVIRGALGEFAFERLYTAKMSEWDEYRLYVTEWELDRYLEVL